MTGQTRDKIARNSTFEAESRNIVFFDGHCNFCNGTVDWVWKRNRDEDLYFSSLQSDFAGEFLRKKGIDHLDLNTIYFHQEGQLYQKSSAVLRIMLHFNTLYRALARISLVIPGGFRDSIYMFIAKRRYRIAGQRETCRIPTPTERARFID